LVVQLLGSAKPVVDNLAVTLHEKITGVDGTYDFDATVRYRFAGMSFLVLVEAKLHKNPIKRELVQVLHQKVKSVGGHKGLMISAAPYQRGAIDFARVHGLALVTLFGNRLFFETRGVSLGHYIPEKVDVSPTELLTFVSHHYEPNYESGSASTRLLSPQHPEYAQYVARLLLGCPKTSGRE